MKIDHYLIEITAFVVDDQDEHACKISSADYRTEESLATFGGGDDDKLVELSAGKLYRQVKRKAEAMTEGGPDGSQNNSPS